MSKTNILIVEDEHIAALDIQQSLEERPIGKLGLHLVKNLTDDIKYEHKEGQTILTIKKVLKGYDV